MENRLHARSHPSASANWIRFEGSPGRSSLCSCAASLSAPWRGSPWQGLFGRWGRAASRAPLSSRPQRSGEPGTRGRGAGAGSRIGLRPSGM